MRLRYLLFALSIFIAPIISQAQSDSSHLMYAYYDDASANIERYFPETQTTETILSFDNQFFRCVWFSEDGNTVAYTTVDNNNFAYSGGGFDAINTPVDYVIYDIEQEAVRFTLEDIAFRNCPEWSSDEQFFAYLTNELTFVNANIGQPATYVGFDFDIVRMTVGETTARAGGVIDWSPMNDRVAFTAGGEVYIYELGGELTEVVATPRINEQIVGWSPNGDFLAIQANATLQTEDNIYLGMYSLNDGTLWRITDDFEGTNIVLTYGWQPNTQSLIYSPQDDMTIYVANPITGGITILIDNPDDQPSYLRWVGDNTLVSVQNRERDADNVYLFDIVRDDLATGEQRVVSASEDDVMRGVYELTILPNGEDYLIQFWKYDDIFTLVEYNASEDTFIELYETPALVGYNEAMVSSDGLYATYIYRTNAPVVSDDSNFLSYVIDLETGEATLLFSQPYTWQRIDGFPVMQWITG